MQEFDTINCQFSRSIYSEGSTVAAFIFTSKFTDNTYNNCIDCHIQAYGHIFADQRWTKWTNKLTENFLQSTGCILDENFKSPILNPQTNNSMQSACLFITQQECFDINQISDGFFVQFELSPNMFPSFRGLSVSIVYNLCVSISTNSMSKQFVFPFQVAAQGAASQTTELKTSTLSILQGKALSKEFKLQSTMISHDFENDDDPGRFNLITPNNIFHSRIMSDHGIICSFSYTKSIHPSSSIKIIINFEEAQVVFPIVRLKFIQSELRHDKTRIQDKILDSATRYVSHALKVQISFDSPSNQPTSFTSCIAQVEYYLEVEFAEEDKGSKTSNISSPSASFSWKFPVEIIPRPPIKSFKKELLACTEPSAFLITQEI